MPNYSRHISNRLFHLWLAVLLLCCLPITDFGAQRQEGVRRESISEECVTKYDGLHRYMMQERQMPLAATVITAKNGERIGSSRPVRLSPTHGGKPSRTLWRWISNKSLHLSNLHALLLRRIDCGRGVSAASPRYYYVIALRRILC